MSHPPTRWTMISRAEQSGAITEALKDCAVIGLDTETVWTRGGQEASQVSLIQLARPAGEVFVVDALAIGVEAARQVVESDEVIKVAHNARFDEGVLIGAGLRPRAFVDTLQLARWSLDSSSYSLKTIVGQLFVFALSAGVQPAIKAAVASTAGRAK